MRPFFLLQPSKSSEKRILFKSESLVLSVFQFKLAVFILLKSTSMRTFEHFEYWAYYLNRSTSNLLAILNQVAGRLKLSETQADSSLHKHPVLLETALDSDSKRLRWVLLSRYLPVLKTFQYAAPKLWRRKTDQEKAAERRRLGRVGSDKTLNDGAQLREIEHNQALPVSFIDLIRFLGHARNYFTHYYFKGEETVKSQCYSKFRRNAFDFETVLRPIWNKGILLSRDRFEYKLKRYRWLIAELNAKYHYDFINLKGELTIKGLAYFTCLFLERREAHQFLSRLSGFSTYAEEQHVKDKKQATLITYTAHCCKLPKPVLEVADHRPRVQLLTQVLEELSRCPAVLFDRLAKADQEQLAYLIRHDRLGNTEVNLADQQDRLADDEIQTKVYPIRKRSRFGYFLLRFIEEVNLFEGLRFQIQLGKATLKHEFEGTYPHKWPKAVRTFGRLAYFEKLKAEAKIDLDYYKQFSPHYHLTNDGISFVFDARSDEASCPKFVRQATDERGFSKLTLERQTYPPIYRIHICDLMVAVFLKLKDSSFDLKKDVTGLAEKYRKFLKDAAAGKFKVDTKADFTEELRAYSLKPSDVPQDVKRSLQNYQLDYNTRTQNLLLKARNQTQKRLDNLKQAAPKVGNIAAYLVEDIIKKMLPKSGSKTKFSADDYQTLQANFCNFRLEKESIKAQLQQLITLKLKRLQHPFLHIAIPLLNENRSTLKEFYEKYLEARISFLEERLCKNFDFQQLEKYHFMSLPYENQGTRKVPRTYDLEYLKCYYAKYLESDRPFVVPRGVFNNLVDQQLGIENKQASNFIYSMLRKTKDRQNFYAFKRKVRLNMSKEGVKIGSPEELWEVHRTWKNKAKKHKKKQEYEREKNAWHKYFVDEKKIRLYQVQDQVLLEMAKYLASNLEDNLTIKTDTWTLGRLRYKTETAQHAKNLLDEDIKVCFELRKGKNKTLVSTKTSLKKYGAVNVFLRTKRVRELVPKLKEDEISLEDLETCITALDKYGYEEAFKHVQGLEKACHAQGFPPASTSQKDYYRHNDYLRFLHLNPEIQSVLNNFRNSFCHSGFNFRGNFRLEEVLDKVKAVGLQYDRWWR